jgi:hypothetical protein
MVLLFSWLNYLSQKSGDLDFFFENLGNLGHFLTMKKNKIVYVEAIFFKSKFCEILLLNESLLPTIQNHL